MSIDTLSHHILCTDDALAYVREIKRLRDEVEGVTMQFAPHLTRLKEQADGVREQRDKATEPLTEEMDGLRAELIRWLIGDPDGNVRDGDRIVATVARKPVKPQIHAEQVPDEFKSMQVDMGKVNAALARGEKVPGVVVKVETSLRVL